MFTSEYQASPHIKRVKEREEKIRMHRFLLEFLPETKELAGRKPLVSLKTLYSDFVVREVLATFNSSEPLTLDSIPLCDSAINSMGRKSEKRPRGGLLPDEAMLDVVRQVFAPLISEEDLDVLIAGLEKDEKRILLGKTKCDKSQRTAIHQAVKTTLSSTHVSTTEGGFVVVVKATATERREEKRRSKPLSTRPFLHFTLYKENLDSTQAFRAMAKHLHLSTRQFQYCGTKDKRAVTTQRVAVREMDPERLSSLNQSSFGTRAVLKVCAFKEEPTGLRLGEACGNYFHIALRLHPCSVLMDEAQLAIVKAALERVGVINYFGPQRFGTTDILTSDIGFMLLRGQYRQAIQAIFDSKACINPLLKEVAALVRSEHYARALEKVPYYCFQERDILKHLSRHPNDYLGMLQVIPRTLAMLYFHAAQSFIWNLMVSRRLSDQTRIAPEVGDLVLASIYKSRMSSDWLRGEADDGFTQAPIPSQLGEQEAKIPAVHRLSVHDDLSRFELTDILLPVPGPDAELWYPQSRGCTREDYLAEMSSLGVHKAFLDDASFKPFVKIFHYHGTYRAVCVKPHRMDLSLTEVSNWLQPVILTDWEKINSDFCQNGKSRIMEASRVESICQGLENASTSDQTPPRSQSSIQVLMVKFMLPPGSYATTVLREFCVATSAGFHEEAAEVENNTE